MWHDHNGKQKELKAEMGGTVERERERERDAERLSKEKKRKRRRWTESQ